MFNKSTTDFTKTVNDICNYIDGTDVYNSRILDLLKDPSLPRTKYIINTNEYRPDLIAKDIYGDTIYLPYLMLSCCAGLASFRKGTVLEVLPKHTIEGIINSL
jgi:hypothetical protein